MLHKSLGRNYLDKELGEKHGRPNFLSKPQHGREKDFGNLTGMGIKGFEIFAAVTRFKGYRICDRKCNDHSFLLNESNSIFETFIRKSFGHFFINTTAFRILGIRNF
jgi:hypothetical protein